MNIINRKNTILSLAALGCIGSLWGAAALHERGYETFASDEAGQEFLESKGYEVLSEGRIKEFNGCSHMYTNAREYDVRTAEGKETQKTVCFGVLTYLAPFR